MSHANTWAEEEFGTAELGDTRRRLRLIQLATRAAEQSGGTVTSVLRDESEREGAFRFLGNTSVSVEAIAASAHQSVLQHCEEEVFFHVAVDQTSLTFADRMRNKGLGPAGKGVHPKA